MSGQPGVQPYRRGVKQTAALQVGFDILLLVTVFFLARGSLLGELYPFSTAVIVTMAFRRQHLLWPVVLVAMLSSYFTGPAPDYSRLLIFLFIGLAATFYPSLSRCSTFTQATLAPMATILVRGLSLTIWQPSFYGWVLIIFEAALAWGLCMIFLEVTTTTRQEERLLGGGLFLMGIILGVQGWQVFSLSLQGLISRYVLLLVALAGGAGAGAAAGTVVGFLPSLSQLTTPALAGLLAFAGLIAGSLKSLGKAGVICGFLLAHLLLTNYFLGQDSVTTALKEGGLAALALLLTPAFLVNYVKEYLLRPVARQQAQPDKQTQEKLREALKSLSRALKFPGFNESPWEAVLQAARTTCRGCPAGKVCWELEGEQMLNLLQELLQRGSQGPLTSVDVPEWLASRCSRSRELLASLTIQADKMQVCPAEKGFNSWLANTFDALAAIIAERESRSAISKRDSEVLPLWQVTVGTATVPRYQSDITGDAYLAATLEPGRQILVLGDGMGVGREAADTSSTAIELIRDLLNAGFTAEMALQTVNMILFLRTGKEIFTTLDLAIINPCSGTVEFYKLGACPSFIRRDGVVKILSRNSLPVGILEEFQVEPLQEEIQDGDLLVMVSDGVLEAHHDINDKEKWVAKALQRAGDARPQEIAERLLKQARALVNDKPRDDMTVLVARLEKARV